MASIYLVNALYNKPSAPAAPTMQGMTEVKQEVIASDDRPAAVVEEPATTTVNTDSATAAAADTGGRATEGRHTKEVIAFDDRSAADTGGRAIEARHTEVKLEQHEQQKGAGDAMHPARQLMVEFLGPLDEQPEPVPYKVSGANMQPLGHTPSPGPKKRGKGAMKKQKLVAPEPPASGDIQAARERSFKAVAPSATAAVRLGQHLQNINGNQINVGRDPRRRAQAGERHDASSSPAPASAMLFGPVLTKQEEAACEPSDQPQIKLFAPATTIASSPQRAESVPYYPMVGRGQLHRPVSTVGVLPNTLAVRPKQLDSDSASDSEARIRELEDKNLSLRKAGFCKDREIRKLKAELRKLGIRTSATHDAAFETSMKRIEAGIKRPRSVEDVGGPVMEP